MKRIAFITHTAVDPHETFIFDLIDRLSRDPELDITLISGRSRSDAAFSGNVKVVPAGFYTLNEKRSHRAYFLSRVLGKDGAKERTRVLQKGASRALSSAIDIRNYDLAYIDYFTTAVWVREHLEKKGVPYVVHAHGYDVTAATSESGYKEELQKVFSGCRTVIVASHHIRRLVTLLGCDPSKITVVRYGIDHTTIKPMSWAERKKLPPSLVFIGRLTEKKHPIALLYALSEVKKKHPKILLHLVGEGPLQDETEHTITQLGLIGNVKLHGRIDRTKSFPLLNAAWVYVQHSVTANTGDQEGFAISPAEGAAHGLPVVSTLHNGITEHVKHGKTGFLVQEHDFESMAFFICSLVGDPQLAESLGEAGKKNILEMCNMDRRCSEIKTLIAAACKQTSGT